jgi:hypothetical protein
MDFEKIRFYHLHKQNLLKKADPGEYKKVLIDHIALHSTDYLTPYLSLWARIKIFEPKILFDDLNDPFNALRMRVFRGTIFVMHRENLKSVLAASKIFSHSIVKQNEKFLVKNGIDLAGIKQAVCLMLAKNQEMSAKELKKGLPEDVKGEYLSYALRYLEFSGILVRTNHRYITDRVIRYGLMSEWFPETVHDQLNPDHALQTLILQYIKKFGPICLDDLYWWLSITKTTARKNIDALNKKLMTINFNDKEYFMEREDYESFNEFRIKEIEAPIINFLPYEDHFPKAFFIRNWFLSDSIAPLVYKEGVIYRGQIFPSIWLNGEIIGGWEMNWADKNKTEMKVSVTALNEGKKLSNQVQDLIESQRADLERFITEKLVPLMRK